MDLGLTALLPSHKRYTYWYTELKKPLRALSIYTTGGRGEIRTHGGLSSSPVFKTGAFNRSATLPMRIER